MIDEKIKQWATPRQCEIIDAVIREGSMRAAARALGIDRKGVSHTLRCAQKRAALAGYSPEHGMNKTAPEPYIVKGVSTLYDQDGVQRAQWVKTSLDDTKREEMIRATIEGLSSEIPRAKPVRPPKHSESALLNQIVLTDCHIGMRSWHPETGADWDLQIAEETIVNAAAHLIRSSPVAGTCIIAQIGDFLHYDGMAPITPLHGNVLDADGRYPKVVSVAVRALRRIVQSALQWHESVILLVGEGNHDMASSVWLQHLFALLYENEPRVKVLESPNPYYAHQHGRTMLCYHHGHLSKNDQLPLLFATQFPKMWGNTNHRYAHTGHRHHAEEKEHNGMTVHQHRTIAAQDAYAARGGWLAGRDMTAITYHSEHGQVARNTIVPEMLG